MKNTPGNKLRLGIFVTASLALFTLAIYFIGQRQQLFSDSFHLSVVFKDISGLQGGNNVRFSGINVGIVEDIEQITDSTVRINMRVIAKAQKFIKKNARATIGSDGLMGNKIIVISPGTADGRVIGDNDTLTAMQAVSMDEIMVKIKVTADNAAVITGGLASIVENISGGRGTIGKLFMDTVFAKNIDNSIINIKQGTRGFQQNMDAAGNSFLLRGFFKKKNKDKENAQEVLKEKQEDKAKEQAKEEKAKAKEQAKEEKAKAKEIRKENKKNKREIEQ